MTVKVGVIGLGFMGKTHLGFHLKNPRAQIVAFCDQDSRKAAGELSDVSGNISNQAGLRIGKDVKGYQKPEDLLADPRVELVDICLPTHLHAEYSIKALAAGKHVLCEKPMATDLKQADAIVKAARKAKGFFMCAHCMRFWPGWTWLKTAVQSKKYGKVHSAVFRRYSATPTWSWNNWLLNPKQSGAALYDLHIHDTDYIRYVFGNPQAVFSIGNSGKATNGGIDQVITHYFYGDQNLLVCAEGGWNADPSFSFVMRFTVIFEKATADFDLSRADKVLMVSRAGAKDADVIPIETFSGWEGEIDYFLKCVEEGKAPKLISPQEARDSVALVAKELESIKKRKIVKCNTLRA
ncbi:MAG: Gfo/Idh/MocA family oxidoreductase [Planctomycetota bacterium]